MYKTNLTTALLPFVSSLLAALFALAALPSSVAAAPAVSDRLLEDRVAEEVSEEGLSLARLELRLEIRQDSQGGATVSIQSKEGRSVGLRHVPRLDKDREAAIAQLTIVVSALVREHRGHATESWSVAMEPTALASRHRPRSLHVVAMPDADAALTRAAADQLARSYRMAGVDTVLGPVLAPSAEATSVIAHFASSAAEEIGLVNVSLVEGSPRAVITFYDKKGNVTYAMSVVRGQALEAGSAQSGIAVSEKAIDQIATVKGERSAAQEEYERRFVGMDKVMTAGGYGVYEHDYIYLGRTRKRLEGAAFYRAVGREDYARHYESSMRRSRIGGGVFFVALLGTATFGTLALVDMAGPDEDESSIPYGWLTLGGTAAMVGSIWYAVSTEPHAVDAEGRIGLIEAHNRKLREELGLTEDQIEKTRHERRQDNGIVVSPYISQSGGGLGVGARF